MKLTIGMIVKNEEKFLERCLSSIKPILDNVDSELIITDTGSTDRTVEIAKKFTENVLHFDWINDFSAARNFGLEKAQGEWFMYLDADDIFESCDEIINFFNSGEYLKYNSASYIGKNLVDNEGHFAENKQPRLTKLLKETRFKNVVHEVFTTYAAPKKDLKDTAVHYGYLFENEEQKNRKTERNRELLLKKLEKEKNKSAFVYLQLAENETDVMTAIKYAEEGIDRARKLKDISMIPLMKIKANLYLLEKNYKESLSVCNEYFRLDKSFRPSVLTADVEILAIKAWDHYCLKQYNEAVETYSKFFDLYEKVRRGELNTADSDIIMMQVASGSNYISHVVQFLMSAANVGQYELAGKFIKGLDISRYSEGASHIDRLIDAEIKILAHFNYDRADDYIKQHNEKGQKMFCKKLEQTVYYIADKKPVLDILRNYSDYNEKADIIDKYFSGDVQLAELVDHAGKHGIDENADILMIAMDKQYDISELLAKISNIWECVNNGYKLYYGFHKAVENYDINKIANDSVIPAAVEFIDNCIGCTKDFKSPKPGIFAILGTDKLLEKYGMLGSRIRTEDEEQVSNNIRAAICMGKALELRRAGKYKECIAELKNVAAANEALSKAVSDYANAVVAEYEAHIKSNSSHENEFEKLSKAIKANIRRFIEAGDLNSARKTLSEYKAIAPNDTEIQELESMISGI